MTALLPLSLIHVLLHLIMQIYIMHTAHCVSAFVFICNYCFIVIIKLPLPIFLITAMMFEKIYILLSKIIIHIKKLLDSDWLRAVQFK